MTSAIDDALKGTAIGEVQLDLMKFLRNFGKNISLHA